ncbi:sensor histidine kinase [Kribbella ginsengisoli]
MTTPAHPAHQRWMPFGVEVVVLWVALFADGWLNYAGRPVGDVAILAVRMVAMVIGGAIVTLVLIRHRFPRLVLTTAAASLASLLVTVVAVQTLASQDRQIIRPSVAEALGLAILVGTVCRRSAPREAIPLAVLAGIAITLNPLLRPGVDSDWALLAVPAAVLWGASAGVGLVLRDADNLRRTAQTTTRELERLNLARELHDFVAHHVTGIVVLAQGAQMSPRQDPGVLVEIEQAGTEALTAMRRLVGMLRTDTFATLADALKDACGNDSSVRLRSGDFVVPAELIDVAHRIALEAVTNARRYGSPASRIDVTARLDGQLLVLQVANQVAAGNHGETARGGGSAYGLVGMRERAEAVGGTLMAGVDVNGRWLVTAALPLARDRSWI